MSNTSERQQFLNYPGLTSYLNEDSPRIGQPVGMEYPLQMFMQIGAMAMRQMEKNRFIRVVVEEPFLIPSLNVKQNDMLELLTNYGFYCDPQPECAITAIICCGPPLDTPRLISSHMATPIRVITPVRVTPASLIIVPAKRYGAWERVLKSTYLETTFVRSEADLTQLSVEETPEKTDVILLASHLYRSFNRTIKGIKWARLVIDESEDNPKIVNSQYMTEMADFTWFLVEDPSAWIENPKVKSRFSSLGIVRNDKIWPELFYVRSDPEYLKNCPKCSDLGEPEPIEITGTQLKLGRLTLQHNQCQSVLTNAYSNGIEVQRYQFRVVESDLVDAYNQALNQKYLAIGKKIHETIASFPACLDVSEVRCLHHNLAFIKQAGLDHLNSLARTLHDTMGELISGSDQATKCLLDEKMEKAITIYSSFLGERDNIIQEAISSSTVCVPYSPEMRRKPLYIINRLEDTPDGATLEGMFPWLYSGYIMAFGCVFARSFLTASNAIEPAKLVVGLSQGLRVLSGPPTGRQIGKVNHYTEIILVADGTPREALPSILANSFIAPYTNNTFDVGAYLIDVRARFRLVKETYFLNHSDKNKPASQIIHRTLPVGSEIILCWKTAGTSRDTSSE